MRNLKRALSLLLAVVMVIGMMVVSTSAASYTDFSDKGEIVNKDAVSMVPMRLPRAWTAHRWRR